WRRRSHIGAAKFSGGQTRAQIRSEEHTSELQSLTNLVCRLLLEKKEQVLSTADNAVETENLHHNGEYGTATRSAISCPILANFFFNDTATTEIYTLSLHDALPI